MLGFYSLGEKIKSYLNPFGNNVAIFHISHCHLLIQNLIHDMLQLPATTFYIWHQLPYP